MKKVVVILAAITFSLTACHYGKDEANKSLERNEKYKSENVEQGPAIDAEYVEKNGTKTQKTVATDSAVHATDSTHQEATH